MKTLLFKTHKSPGLMIPGEVPYWVGKPILRSSLSYQQIARQIANERNMPVEDVLFIYRRTDEIIVQALQSGHNVNFDMVGYSINLTGRFDSKDDTFNLADNALLVSAYAKPIVRDCLKDITPRNVTGGLKASIGSVTDDHAYTVNVITVPSRVLVAGVDLLINTDNHDEGVWLFGKDGSLAATPTILANTISTIDLDFGELPPDGEYTLVVKARSGADVDYSPATARKTVTVARS